jgi:hypothetical protein
MGTSAPDAAKRLLDARDMTEIGSEISDRVPSLTQTAEVQMEYPQIPQIAQMTGQIVSDYDFDSRVRMVIGLWRLVTPLGSGLPLLRE